MIVPVARGGVSHVPVLRGDLSCPSLNGGLEPGLTQSRMWPRKYRITNQGLSSSYEKERNKTSFTFHGPREMSHCPREQMMNKKKHMSNHNAMMISEI